VRATDAVAEKRRLTVKVKAAGRTNEGDSPPGMGECFLHLRAGLTFATFRFSE
jgi:hypothetical protein